MFVQDNVMMDPTVAALGTNNIVCRVVMGEIDDVNAAVGDFSDSKRKVKVLF